MIVSVTTSGSRGFFGREVFRRRRGTSSRATETSLCEVIHMLLQRPRAFLIAEGKLDERSVGYISRRWPLARETYRRNAWTAETETRVYVSRSD